MSCTAPISIERNLALEAAIEPLAVRTMATLGLDLLFATHGQETVLKQHFDIAFFQAREFRRNPILLVGILDIQARPPEATELSRAMLHRKSVQDTPSTRTPSGRGYPLKKTILR